MFGGDGVNLEERVTEIITKAQKDVDDMIEKGIKEATKNDTDITRIAEILFGRTLDIFTGAKSSIEKQWQEALSATDQSLVEAMGKKAQLDEAKAKLREARSIAQTSLVDARNEYLAIRDKA
jgi:hypothetical protein